MNRIVSLPALAGLIVLPLAAQETTNQVTRLPEIVVTATRLPEQTIAVEKVPAHVTVITREQIAASPALTVQELLQTRAGLMPLDTTGLGQDARLSLRGYGEKSGVLVLVDGVRVNHAGTGDFLGNLVVPADLERIEIIRGGASTTYGEGAVGGVVNLITRRAAGRPIAATVTASVGSYGFYGARADVSGSTNRLSYYLSVDRREWDGWREFSGFQGWNVTARPSIETAAGRFTLSYRFHDEFNQVPGNLRAAQFAANPRASDPTRQSTFNIESHQAALEWHRETDAGLALSGRLHGQQQRSVGTFGGGFILHSRQPNLGAAFQQTWVMNLGGREHTFSLGQEGGLQDYRIRDNFGGFSFVDAWTLGAFAQGAFSLSDRLTLTLGTRFDYREWDIAAFSPGFYDLAAARRAEVWSPKASLNWSLGEAGDLWLSVSRAYRLPSGDDISAVNFAVFPPVGFAIPNPNVAPVDARTIELGARWKRSPLLGGSLAAFFSEVQDDLFFDPTPAATAANRNFKSERLGLELELQSRPREWIEFFSALAWTDARFRSGPYDGNSLTLVPEWNAAVGFTLRPSPRIEWRWELVQVNGQVPVNDVQNAFDRNAYTALNTRVAYRWRTHTAFVSVNNLTDTRYEQFPAVGHPFAGAPFRAFNPAPGLSVQLGLTARF